MPSIPWTEIWAYPDTTEVDPPAPAAYVFQNGTYDDLLVFQSDFKSYTPTEGVAINPIIQDGNNTHDTVLDARTHEWVQQLDPNDPNNLQRGPHISSDSVVIPVTTDQAVSHAGTWWRGTSVGGVDEVFVRVTYENFPPETATLVLYIVHPSGIPIEQKVTANLFASSQYDVNGESSGLRTWFLNLNRDELESFDGGTYEVLVEMIDTNGDVVDSVEFDIPFGEEV